jgi:hypothetical protein
MQLNHTIRPAAQRIESELVEIIPWQETPALLWQLCQAARTSDNFRAWMQMPEWVNFRWRPFTQAFMAKLRDPRTGSLLAVTPLVEDDYPLHYFIAGHRLATVPIRGLLINGNIPLFPNSDQYYEALCRAALSVPSIDCVYMLGVPKTSHFWHFLTKAKKIHPEWYFYSPEFKPSGYCYIDMNMSYDEYLRKFKASTRQKFGQRLRLLEKECRATVDLVRITDAAEVSEFLGAAEAIAKKSWQKGLLGFPVAQAARREEVLKSLARRGILRSYLLKSEDRGFAYLIGTQLNQVYYAFETAFDGSYSGTRLSPGQSLYYLAIKDCFEINKPNIFHFGPGSAQNFWYKGLFANRIDEENTILILHNTVANRSKVLTHRIFERAKLGSKSLLFRLERRQRIAGPPVQEPVCR